MTKHTPTALAGIVLGVVGMLTTACGSSDSDGTTSSSGSSSSAPAVTKAEGTQPDWALPATAPGQKLTSFDLGPTQVDIYQVDTFKASQDVPGAREGKTPVTKGDELVLLNIVMTNKGEAVQLDGNVVEVSPAYPDHPELEMSGLMDEDVYARNGVNLRAVDYDKDPARPYTFNTGDVVSVGLPFKYLKGERVDLAGYLTLADVNARVPEATASITLN